MESSLENLNDDNDDIDDNDDNDSKAGADLPVIIIHVQVEHTSLQFRQREPWDR